MQNPPPDPPPPDVTGSVTGWLRQLEHGSDAAAAALWERYFTRILILAKGKLSANDRRVADEEDVVVSVFDILCRGKIEGRFPQLQDREDLWKLLVVITQQKAIDRHRHATRQKRGGGKSEVSLDDPINILDIASQAPTPDFLMLMEDEYQRLLAMLRNVQLRTIAVNKMEGYTHQEIADSMHVCVRTIDRKVQLIQEKWASLLAKDN